MVEINVLPINVDFLINNVITGFVYDGIILIINHNGLDVIHSSLNNFFE